jgi:hypothetical protein
MNGKFPACSRPHTPRATLASLREGWRPSCPGTNPANSSSVETTGLARRLTGRHVPAHRPSTRRGCLAVPSSSAEAVRLPSRVGQSSCPAVRPCVPRSLGGGSCHHDCISSRLCSRPPYLAFRAGSRPTAGRGRSVSASARSPDLVALDEQLQGRSGSSPGEDAASAPRARPGGGAGEAGALDPVEADSAVTARAGVSDSG